MGIIFKKCFGHWHKCISNDGYTFPALHSFESVWISLFKSLLLGFSEALSLVFFCRRLPSLVFYVVLIISWHTGWGAEPGLGGNKEHEICVCWRLPGVREGFVAGGGDKMLWPVRSNLLTARQTSEPATLAALIGKHGWYTPSSYWIFFSLLNTLVSLGPRFQPSRLVRRNLPCASLLRPASKRCACASGAPTSKQQAAAWIRH